MQEYLYIGMVELISVRGHIHLWLLVIVPIGSQLDLGEHSVITVSNLGQFVAVMVLYMISVLSHGLARVLSIGAAGCAGQG